MPGNKKANCLSEASWASEAYLSSSPNCIFFVEAGGCTGDSKNWHLQKLVDLSLPSLAIALKLFSSLFYNDVFLSSTEECNSGGSAVFRVWDRFIMVSEMWSVAGHVAIVERERESENLLLRSELEQD